jgi:hypothetical protein
MRRRRVIVRFRAGATCDGGPVQSQPDRDLPESGPKGAAAEVASSAEIGGTQHIVRRWVARRLRGKEAERLVAHGHHL